MKKKINKIRDLFYRICVKVLPKFSFLNYDISWNLISSSFSGGIKEDDVKLYPPYHISDSFIGKGTYISQNSYISFTSIGRYCSIGPNLICGWGIHPTNGISTSPMFYSTNAQNGTTLCKKNKIKEREKIIIGNDVFIGMNVTILDGVSIGDGAIIGAGSVVSKDIPPYAIAVGVPIRILKYRFNEEQVTKLLKISWWEFSNEELKNVENYFFEIEKFIEKYDR